MCTDSQDTSGTGLRSQVDIIRMYSNINVYKEVSVMKGRSVNVRADNKQRGKYT